LIINALDDPAAVIEGARNLFKKIPNSKLIEIKSGGHLFIGKEDKVRQEIDNFIKEIAM